VLDLPFRRGVANSCSKAGEQDGRLCLCWLVPNQRVPFIVRQNAGSLFQRSAIRFSCAVKDIPSVVLQSSVSSSRHQIHSLRCLSPTPGKGNKNRHPGVNCESRGLSGGRWRAHLEAVQLRQVLFLEPRPFLVLAAAHLVEVVLALQLQVGLLLLQPPLQLRYHPICRCQLLPQRLRSDLGSSTRLGVT
jgi:hypothetical protein